MNRMRNMNSTQAKLRHSFVAVGVEWN